MRKRYEALLILKTQGKEEQLKDTIDRISEEFRAEGVELEQVQKMERRQFSYVAGDLDAGFYVNFIFAAEPEAIDRLKARFRLDTDVYRQHYQRLVTNNVASESAAG